MSRQFDKTLTAQEDAVLRLMGTGAGDKNIGANLHLNERTVQRHVRSIFAKLGVSNRMQAVVRAVRNGLIDI